MLRLIPSRHEQDKQRQMKLTIEEKLQRWKQAKQEAVQSKKSSLGGERCDAKRKPLAVGGKRKLAESKTIDGCLTKTTSSGSLALKHSNASHKNPRLTANNDRKKPAPHTPDGTCQNPIVLENGREMPVPSKPTPTLKKSSQDPNISPLQLKKTCAGDPDLDKENRRDILVVHNQNLPAPVASVDKKPELLAKDLVRVAIAFEKKRRLATAFSIFKRANHVLPKKSAKLIERLARLEQECATVADQLPSQEIPTATYMVQVLERDLMAVLNNGSTKELTELHAIGGKRAELVREKRPYQKLDDLNKVPGISANVISKLYEHHTHWENSVTFSVNM